MQRQLHLLGKRKVLELVLLQDIVATDDDGAATRQILDELWHQCRDPFAASILLLERQAQLEGRHSVHVGVAASNFASFAAAAAICAITLEFDDDVGTANAASLLIGCGQHVDGDALQHVAWQEHFRAGQVSLLGIPQCGHQHTRHILHLRFVPMWQCPQEIFLVVIGELWLWLLHILLLLLLLLKYFPIDDLMTVVDLIDLTQLMLMLG